MVRTRKSPSRAERAAITNPIVAAATLMVDVHEDGSVSAVLGRLDLTSRRYVFTRCDLLEDGPYRAGQMPLALYHVAQRCWRDFVDAPFRTL